MSSPRARRPRNPFTREDLQRIEKAIDKRGPDLLDVKPPVQRPKAAYQSRNATALRARADALAARLDSRIKTGARLPGPVTIKKTHDEIWRLRRLADTLDPPREPHADELTEMVNNYHLYRTFDDGTMMPKYKRVEMAVKGFVREHPEFAGREFHLMDALQERLR